MTTTEKLNLGEAALLTEKDVQQNRPGDLTVMGFSVMCSWHFLVLFSCIPLDNSIAGRDAVLQLVLFFSLAVSYAVISLFSKQLVKTLYRRGSKRWIGVNIVIGVIASGVSLFAIFSLSASRELAIASHVLLGASQAMLMFPWLQLPQVKDDKTGNYRNLTFNMGLGGVIALLVANLQEPFFFVAISALPVIANVMLAVYWGSSTELKTGSEGGIDAEHSFRPSDIIITNAHFIVFGFAFGLCQFVFSANAIEAEGVVNFVVGNAWVLTGIFISAIVIFFIPEHFFKTHGVFTVQRFSLIVLLAGTMLALYFIVAHDDFGDDALFWGGTAGQVLFLAGFNIFDFGFMVFSFTWAARLKTDFAAYIGYNRSILYLSMGVGMGAGYLLLALLPGASHLEVATVAVVTLLLVLTTLPFFDDFAPYGKIVSVEEIRKEEAVKQEVRQREEREAEAGVRAARWKERVEAIANEYNLSKREREVFSYLAKGRNAAYIQQELWISIHTVKTHMFNIYRKLEVHSIQEILDMVDQTPHNLENDTRGTANSHGASDGAGAREG